jgi:phenylalanyl-tRNA synthetase beta chain
MKFSEQWLRTWVNPLLSTQELVEQLTMAGLEMESVEPVATPFDKVVIGEVLSVEDHPDAKKLHVCQVNVGQAEPLTIVCGAKNVEAGMRVPTALIGAQLSDMTIKETKLRGVASYGMLCSAQELGLAENSEGLLALPKDAPVGKNIREYLDLDDMIIDIDLTPNRGDCLGIEGIAREVGALTGCPVTIPNFSAVPATISDIFPVTIENTVACPRYVGRVIRGVNAKAETPLWMKERLRRSGMRSISAIVDVTNYILLELGQPMHAFDLGLLSEGICVRMADSCSLLSESLTLLDEQTVKLDSTTLVIADRKMPHAIAGVMGGLKSAVSATTQDIFLECAFFTPHLLSGCARRYGLHTESSHRFERGVNPQLQRRACERATALLLDIVGGQAGPVSEICDENQLPTAKTIELRQSNIYRVLGHHFESADVIGILSRLGMRVESNESGWQVCPPSFRFDIALEVDLIEELARVQGYNRLPSSPPKSHLLMRQQPAVNIEELQAVLVQRGYQESVTYSFVDPAVQTLLNAEKNAITLGNPIASDMSVMRTTLWAGLLQAVLHNQKRQQSRVRLFETGLRFVQSENGIQQDKMIAGIVTGQLYPEQWGDSSKDVDFFDIKADVQALLAVSGKNYHFMPSIHSALHSGQTATIYQGDQEIGILGAIHPSVIRTLDLIPPVYVFELQLMPLYQKDLPHFSDISKYPSVRRDIALVLEQSINADKVLDCIKKSSSDLLNDLQLFDLYQGQGIELGKKSFAISLIFQSFSRNLIESEIDTAVTQILHSLQHNLGAQLRK